MLALVLSQFKNAVILQPFSKLSKKSSKYITWSLKHFVEVVQIKHYLWTVECNLQASMKLSDAFLIYNQ